MSFLYPGFLWIGAIASAAVVALHFIVTRQPKSEAFPTARFVPDSAVEAVSRANRPSDLLLLLLRVLAVMALASAFARPAITSTREPKVRIILADLSRSSQDSSEVVDSVARYFGARDVLIGFDSVPRVISQPDSLRSAFSPVNYGNLSAALIQSIRTASRLRERADSISLTVVSSLPAGSWDAATDTIRSLWPGAIEIVRVNPRRDTVVSLSRDISGDFASDDPLRFSATLAGKTSDDASVRFIRSGTVSKPDLAHEVILHWPSRDRPTFARPAKSTSHGALIAGNAVVIAPFVTAFEFPQDSLKDARIIARWEDGTPAAIQRTAGPGCVRASNIPVTSRGDLAIRPEFVAVVRELTRPCNYLPVFVPASDARLVSLKGGSAAAPRSAFPAAPPTTSRLSLWLFLAAIACLLAEQFLRRRAEPEQATSQNRMRAAA